MNNYYQQPTRPPMMNMPYQQQQTQQIFLKGRPVSSLEEVKAQGIDFDGSVFFFPDFANKRIYTKQINLDGTALINMYELSTIPEVPSSTNFITREEFEQSINQLKTMLEQSNQSSQGKNESFNF